MSRHIPHSEFLTPTQLKGLNKVGDVLVPGTEDMPSFSQTNSLAGMDRICPHLYADDLQGVKGLLVLFRLLPKPLIALIFLISEKDRWFPGILGALLRMINLGVKGIVFTLYYADQGQGRIYQKMNWHTYVGEAPEGEQASSEAVPSEQQTTAEAVRV